jgi:hypothetical protein
MVHNLRPGFVCGGIYSSHLYKTRTAAEIDRGSQRVKLISMSLRRGSASIAFTVHDLVQA